MPQEIFSSKWLKRVDYWRWWWLAYLSCLCCGHLLPFWRENLFKKTKISCQKWLKKCSYNVRIIGVDDGKASLGCLLCTPSAIFMRKSLIICSYVQENRNFLLKKNDEVWTYGLLAFMMMAQALLLRLSILCHFDEKLSHNQKRHLNKKREEF